MHHQEPQTASTRQSWLRGPWPAARNIVAAGVLGFGAVAWWPVWPIDLPAYGLVDGAILVALGTAVMAVPALLALMALLRGWGNRRSRTWLGVAVVLGLSALYVAYFWGSLMLYFREPANTFLW